MFNQVHDASKIVLEKLNSWLHDAIIMLPNFVIAVLVLFLFIIIQNSKQPDESNSPAVVINSSVLNL